MLLKNLRLSNNYQVFYLTLGRWIKTVIEWWLQNLTRLPDGPPARRLEDIAKVVRKQRARLIQAQTNCTSKKIVLRAGCVETG